MGGELAELQFWPVTDHVVPVYLFAGQSNMDGRAAITGYPSYMSGYKTTPAAYAYWSYCNGKDWAWNQFGGKLLPYQPYNDEISGVATNTGFDGVVYHQIEEALQKRFYVIKESLGGAPIDPSCESWQKGWWYADAEWMASHNPQGENSSLAKEFTNNIGLCIDNVLSNLANGYDIKCIVWHQGCSDRTQPANYKENLRTLVNYLRNFIAEKTGNSKYLQLPFICCNINPSSTQYNATVDQAKHELAKEMVNFYEVSFADCSLGDDNLHHDAAGYIKGAERVYNKMVELGLVSTDEWTYNTLGTSTQLRDAAPVTRAENLDLTGNTYYVMQFVNGNKYYINAGDTENSFKLQTEVSLTDDNIFCIESIIPAPTGTYANWQYRLKTKSGKYLGYNSGTVCLYNAIQNENTTNTLQTTPLLFANGTNGITVQRNGNSWKAISYDGASLKFASGTGESAQLQFLPVEVTVYEPAGSAYAFNLHSTVTPCASVTPGKWYKFRHANTSENDLKNKYLSSYTTVNNVYGKEGDIDEAGVWTLESADGNYKIKNLKGEYLTTDGGTAGKQYLVGRSTDANEAAIFTLSTGCIDDIDQEDNCLFTLQSTAPDDGKIYLHFDTQLNNRAFYHDGNGVNSQFKLYEVTLSLSSESKELLTTMADDAADADNGKVGYHDATNTANLSAALTGYYNSTIDFETLKNTHDNYLSSYVMPQSGHVYRISNISPFNHANHYYIGYESDGLKCKTDYTQNDAELFVCREVEGSMVDGEEPGYLFYGLKSGKYLNWKKNYTQTGGSDTYTAADCAFRVVKGYKTTCESGITPDILGTFHIIGHRNETGYPYSAIILQYDNEGAISGWGWAGTENYYFQQRTDDNFSSLMLFEEVDNPGNDITFSNQALIADVGYVATFSFNRPMALPEGYKAYWAEPKEKDGNPYIHMTEVKGAVPAYTGVVVVNDEASTLRMLPLTTETADNSISGNKLQSAADEDAEILTSTNDVYILTRATPTGTSTPIVGFFKLNSLTNRTIARYKSYLQVGDEYQTKLNTSSGIRGYVSLSWGDISGSATGVDSVTNERSNDNIYDLSGRRIDTPAKGLYILNGKKVIVK